MRAAELVPWRAALGLLAGLAFTLAATVLLRGRLLPAGTGEGGAVAFIWGASVLTLVAGLAWAFREVGWLRREYGALADAERRGFLERVAEGDDGGVTLVARRALHVARLLREEADVPTDLRATFRADAVARTAAIGGAARFIASLLLLLAVLGTFAGMKSALPELVAAVQPDAAALDPGSIRQALSTVGDAFGANFLALLGSAAMAMIAFGGMAERRRLLIELERVSELHLYARLPPGADATALQRAVQDLRLSVAAVEAVGDGLRDLQAGIRSFEQALVGAIDDLQATFSASLQRQSIEIQSQLSEGVNRVALNVMEVSEALAATAAAFRTLETRAAERDAAAERAARALESLAGSMPANLERSHDALVRAAERAGAAESRLETAGQRIERSHAEAETRMREAERSLASTAASIEAATARITHALREKDGSVAAMAELRRRVEGLAAETARELGVIRAAIQTAARTDAERDERLEAVLGEDGRQREETVRRMATALGAASRELQRLSTLISEAASRQDGHAGDLARGLARALELLFATREDVVEISTRLGLARTASPGRGAPTGADRPLMDRLRARLRPPDGEGRGGRP